MEVLLIVAVGVVCAFCFMLGAKVGQAVKNGERVEMPSVNPMKTVREREARKEAEREQERVNTILSNIENYDGTGRGQEDVPRR